MVADWGRNGTSGVRDDRDGSTRSTRGPVLTPPRAVRATTLDVTTRLLTSRLCCAAAGAPARPWPHGRKTRAAARKDPEEQSAQPDGARSHRVKFVRPLDTGDPYGCRTTPVFLAADCMSPMLV